MQSLPTHAELRYQVSYVQQYVLYEISKVTCKQVLVFYKGDSLKPLHHASVTKLPVHLQQMQRTYRRSHARCKSYKYSDKYVTIVSLDPRVEHVTMVQHSDIDEI